MSQRWRLTVARGPEGRDLLHRDVTATWNSILAALVVAAAPAVARPRDRSESPPPDDREGGRARVMFAAPAPVGMTSRGELVDLILPAGRLTQRRLQESVEPLLPAGHTLVDAHDVWTGEPSLPSLVTAADYRVEVRPNGERSRDEWASSVARAVDALLAAAVILRSARAEGRAAANLRPLIVELRLDETLGEAARLWMRLRVDPELGAGRPEEVVEALGRFGPSVVLGAVERLGFVLRPTPRRETPVTKPVRKPQRSRPRAR